MVLNFIIISVQLIFLMKAGYLLLIDSSINKNFICDFCDL